MHVDQTCQAVFHVREMLWKYGNVYDEMFMTIVGPWLHFDTS